MYPDVVDLREFYESDLGQLAQKLVREGVRKLWPNIANETVLGIGYATPYLRPFLNEAARVLAFMPAQQGITWWPRGAANLSSLTEEAALPLADNSVDRILMMHMAENTEHIGDVLQEMGRVLSSNGRMIIMVPNRSGWWAREQRTPFGFGFSFSLPHIRRILTHHGFQVERHARALYVPPFGTRFLAPYVSWIEKNCDVILPGLAGVLLIEVSKQVYARPAMKQVNREQIIKKPRFKKADLIPIPGLGEPNPTRIVTEGGHDR
ncbi:MAG: methyltransferase domain-containing protein [Alphaproteobacteria bacterium]|nr:methyltransferase domain-containing protein [Alphaproteobacteria bacterium]